MKVLALQVFTARIEDQIPPGSPDRTRLELRGRICTGWRRPKHLESAARTEAGARGRVSENFNTYGHFV